MFTTQKAHVCSPWTTCFFYLNGVLVKYVSEIRELISCVNKYGGCQKAANEAPEQPLVILLFLHLFDI